MRPVILFPGGNHHRRLLMTLAQYTDHLHALEAIGQDPTQNLTKVIEIDATMRTNLSLHDLEPPKPRRPFYESLPRYRRHHPR